MNRLWRSKLALTLAGSSAIVVGIFACSGGSRPSVADDPGIDLPGHDGGPSTTQDGGGDSGPVPETCSNGKKDGNETDIDCGGNACPKCIDGKACVALTDCAGGACANNKCLTPHCDDKQPNGDESDMDCGGSVCAKCNFGKKCGTATDCLSGACTASKCSCPKGMTEISRNTGGTYCMDEVEVSKGAYYQFFISSPDPGNQDAVCKGNTLFAPRNAWPPGTDPPANGKNFNSSLPVHYVDWCDAYAYCKWAKKQLCGKVTGGAVAVADGNTSTDAWYNACSAGAGYDYPWGNDFRSGKCNGGAPDDSGANTACGINGYGCAENHDDGLYATVNGDTSGSYTGVLHQECGAVGSPYHLIGNVAEWEDSCDEDAGTCRARGGSNRSGNNNADALSCKGMRMVKRLPTEADHSEDELLADVGFRCCLY